MTTIQKKVLAIAGSVRSHSSNHLLLRAIGTLMAGQLEIVIYPSVADLPHFDPGLEGDLLPAAVAEFRALLRGADGVIICTPEYAHGVPGSLKNALDWTVGSGEFSHKPTALITASTDGRFGHQALLETLRVIEAEEIDRLQLLIPFIRTKVSSECEITDEGTREAVVRLMEAFVGVMVEAEAKTEAGGLFEG